MEITFLFWNFLLIRQGVVLLMSSVLDEKPLETELIGQDKGL